MATELLKVVVVDDHAIARDGICLMLGTAADIVVVGEAGTAQAAMAAIAACAVDVALVDISLPGRSGIDLLRMLRARRPEIAVLMLTTHPEETYALRAMQNGAAGYLTKDVSIGVLVAAVRKAADGGKYFSAALGERLVLQLQGGGVGGHEGLSKREFEVMVRLAAGEAVGAIGAALSLSPKTVSTYRSRIFDKLGLASNAALTRYALEEGLI
ncbi:MAG TPA: response regulator transcription factor [Telluria sp.]|nr:response regulator transcription factor [Telluria sp.]